MITVKSKKDLDALQNHTDNEVAYCEELKQFFKWQNGWHLVDKTKNNLQMNLYDLNKSIIEQLKPLTANEIKEKSNLFTQLHNDCKDIHFMLLCKDYNYYTIFEAGNDPITTFSAMISTIIAELGEVYSIEKLENAVEIWIKPTDEEQPYVFYLFPYDKGVVYYG